MSEPSPQPQAKGVLLHRLCPRCDLEILEDRATCPDCNSKLVEVRDEVDLVVGTVIDDRFEIRAKLGQGGMGTVYRAWQKSIGREVAIKLMDRSYSRDAMAVRRFLRFTPEFNALEKQLAQQVTTHATPVGSGTVARTERIPLERRAESAVIAWMRHQTTAYDSMEIARIKGERREVRRQLAEISRAVLDLHRCRVAHPPSSCPLCAAGSRA